MNERSAALAKRIEQGAAELAAYAEGLNEAQWAAVVKPDGRTVGVIVHHVASMYPIEIQIAQEVGAGKAVEGVTWGAVAEINAKHAKEYAAVTKREALEALRMNSRAAAEAVRGLTDQQLDTAAGFSLSAHAPMTAQFVIEDHALRHAWHHLAKIRATLEAREQVAAL